MAFPTFQEAYDVGNLAIRDSVKVKYESRVHPEDKALPEPRYQKRMSIQITYHFDCQSTSLTETDPGFVDFLNKETLPYLVFNVTNPETKQDLNEIWNGPWDVLDIDIADNHDGNSRVTVTQRTPKLSDSSSSWFDPA